MQTIQLGQSIPLNTSHAVSVSLPTWESNVAYEKGEDWVVSQMISGYPRFFIHPTIEALASDISKRLKNILADDKILLFPTANAAQRCIKFILQRSNETTPTLRCLHLFVNSSDKFLSNIKDIAPLIAAVICPLQLYPIARQYWQHTGDGVSSRRAEFFRNLFLDTPLETYLLEQGSEDESSAVISKEDDGIITIPMPTSMGSCWKGPRRYSRYSEKIVNAGSEAPMPPLPTQVSGAIVDETHSRERIRFVEERFGRNLDLTHVQRASSAVKRRLADAMTPRSCFPPIEAASDLPIAHSNLPTTELVPEKDVFLFPCGMNAIYNIHRCLLHVRGQLKSISFGFPYVDTLKILEKFGPGCLFYGNGTDDELDALESRLQHGEKFLALFCEFPGNPLLSCPNLYRIRALANKFDFAIVIDETIGNMANINVMPYADIVVSSLTKVFSGDCNVMGGAAIFNPSGRYYKAFLTVAATVFENNYWPEDIIFMERNSRDYKVRIDGINKNAEAICDILHSSDIVKKIYYPKYNDTRSHYDQCKLPGGGYGGLLSVTFHHPHHAMAFYDAILTAKGPSLGTNFTLTSPYVLLAHYNELEWASEFGLDPYLIRISVGLESTAELILIFQLALKAAISSLG